MSKGLNKMNDFRNQIAEDIKTYQETFSYIDKFGKDEWAFNYWILDKLFFEDEELIVDKIIDYKDMGIDAYVFYEDTLDLYLIQNKYYTDNSTIDTNYVKNDFLLKGITALENGTYNRSKELQNIFKKYKNNENFHVYLWAFVTNNNVSIEANRYIKEYNQQHPNYHAKIFYLDDIESKYYDEYKKVNKELKNIEIETVVKKTSLEINNEDYNIDMRIKGRYVLTPVVCVYHMCQRAKEKGYQLFEKNIREYLGNKGINKKIYQTLLNPTERKNFFYYNNGITIICDNMSTVKVANNKPNNLNAHFFIDNPQIVNGCQTVNSIYEALNESPSDIENEYKDTFVMLKILVIDGDNEYENDLYKNIVKYNNSQNSIDEKTFEANNTTFARLQNELLRNGFLLLNKQSDKNKFKNEYKGLSTFSELKKRSAPNIEKFGLKEIKKVDDLFIPLVKLLQVINAFITGGQTAFTKKSNMLKCGSAEYNAAVSFIKNPRITNKTILDLYLLYKRSEESKKISDEGRFPISYYLIDAFAKYECKERNIELISQNLNDNNAINNIINLYSKVTRAYTRSYTKTNNVDYNKMIKQTIDYDMLAEKRDDFIDI